jgi:protocatechuate 3,4-dioxygenase beta subunit
MRRFPFLLAPLLALLVLAACSDEEPTPSGVVSTAAPTTPTASGAATATVSAASTAAPAATTVIAPVDCTPGAALTPAQTEGPYYRAGAPEKANLVEAGITGTRLVVSGSVLTADCRPIGGAKVDVWQADAAGAYDNAGYRLRGYVLADAQGRYRFETIVPGEYPGRTPHIHVKVSAPNGPVLTSQLYLPGAAANQRDNIFDAGLLLKDVQTASGGMTARFDFIVRA